MHLVASLFLALVALGCLAAADDIGPFVIDASKVTVSGLSGGAFHAVQLHLAYSSVISGAAIFAGGPYYCAYDDAAIAVSSCMAPLLIDAPDASALAVIAQNTAALGDIDSLANLASSKVFVFSGAEDTVVNKLVVDSLVQFYSTFIDASQGGNLTKEFDIPSQHSFPTLSTGSACSYLGEPFINACNYDGAGAALSAMYGSLKLRTQANPSNLLTFDQTSIATGNSLNSLGYIYVPTSCAKGGSCALHLSFHGCEQTTADVQDQYASSIGLNEWAESNSIIVVYPQVSRSPLIPYNPLGCWDWWGYNSPAYASKLGPQIDFSNSIMHTLMSGGHLHTA